MSDLTRKVFAAETAAVNQHLKPSSALDEARAELQRHGHGPAFVVALEHFEAAVRANERAPRQPIDEEQAAALLAPLEAKARQMREHRDATHRAAVLREAADRIDNEELPQDYVDMFDNGARWAARLLRRLADEAQPPAKPSPTAVYLATPCDTCGHTLNWHRNDVGCTAPRCVCGRFHQPDDEAQP
jgi:hypothetical protein